MVWPLASKLFACGDKWLCIREGAAGIQGWTGSAPGASRGCWLGTAWRGGAGAASAEELSSVHPPPLARWGTGRLRQREMQFVWVFGSELHTSGLVQRQTRAGPRARQGTGSGCSRLPCLLLPFSPAAKLRLGFVEAELQRHRKTRSGLRAEGD